MAEWCFRPKKAGETIREPVHGEFFATDAISDPGMALVREGIQNALDAGDGNDNVIVRIYLSGPAETISPAGVEQFFRSAWPHFNARSNGLLPAQVPSTESPCSFLAFEDFGTTGLEGTPDEAFKSREGGKNHFYHFFRAEGQSDKDASDRGSWGVGKHVFLRSSRISTVFGLTVRASDGQKMLMGKSVLKSHYVGDLYCQDGYYGVPPDDAQPLVMPVVEPGLIEDFSRRFRLMRDSEPGLSLVIPWPETDITEQAIVHAVLQDYFFPILAGQLDVIVETPSVRTVLDASTLIDEVSRLDSTWAGNLKPLIELADWARSMEDDKRVTIAKPPDNQACRWTEALFTDDQIQGLRSGFYAGEKLAVRVPVTVRRNDGEQADSFFDVYFIRDSSEQTGKPTFIREGIIISRVDCPRTRGVRAVIVAEDMPLVAFLRTAENPSHTEWQHVRLKNDYRWGYKTDLDFVKRSMHEILRVLTAAEKEEDPTLLADFFSIPAPPDDADAVKTRRQKAKEEEGAEPAEPPVPPSPRPPRFRIHKINGGFSVLPTNNDTSPPATIDIRVAYDIRRGNPLKRYRPEDFSVDQEPIRLDPEPKRLNIVRRSGNRIVVAVQDPDFALHVIGFDKRRQVYVRAVAREDTDGGSTV